MLQSAEEAAAARSSGNSTAALAKTSTADQVIGPDSALAVKPRRVTMRDIIAARPARHSPSVLDYASIPVAATPIREEDSGGNLTIGILEPSRLDILSLARILPMVL